jgi:hypothetical protein
MIITTCAWSSRNHDGVIVNGSVHIPWPSGTWVGAAVAAQIKLAGGAIAALAGDAVQYECTEIATGLTAPRAHTVTQMKQVLLDGKNRAVAYKLHQTDLHNQVAAIVVGGTTTEAIAIALVQAITPAFA